MAMKKNERYRCVNSKCCCEIEVVKAVGRHQRSQSPLCVRARYEEDVLTKFRPPPPPLQF